MNKKKKTFAIVALLLFFVFIIYPVFSSYIEFRVSRIANEHQSEFHNRLLQIIKEEKTFKMKDITPFKWDKMYIFPPYMSKSEMEKEIGKTWTTNKTYLSYLLERETILGELNDDLYHKLVFLNGDTIVLDITLDRSQVDFTHNKKLVLESETVFTVELLEDRYKIVKAIEE